MFITDVLYAAKYGTYGEFLSWYGRPGSVADTGDALIHAILGRQEEGERGRIIRRLLDDGADPNFVSSGGEDGLMLCLKCGARDWGPEGLAWVTEELIGAGLDAVRRDAWGNDALMFAVRNAKQPSEGLKPVWRALLGAGADPTMPGPQGKTTLDWARELSWRAGFLDVAREYGYGEGTSHGRAELQRYLRRLRLLEEGAGGGTHGLRISRRSHIPAQRLADLLCAR